MKRTCLPLITLLSSLSIMTACTGGSSTGSAHIPALRIEEFFDITDLDELSGKIHVVNVFRPEFTDSSMFDSPQILHIADGKAYLHEGKYMTTFSYPDGKLLSAFNRYGAGPEDYQYAYYAYYTPEAGGTWTVPNINIGKHQILQYDEAGRFRRSVTNDSVDVLAPLSDGGWLGFNTSYSLNGGFHKVRDKIITRYSPDWKAIGSTTLKSRRWSVEATDLMDYLPVYNGQVYTTDADTVLRYDLQTDDFVPAIALLEGKYFFDWSSPTTTQEIRAAEADHLNPLTPIFNSRYAFITYYWGPWPDNITRSDVYDLSTGRLVFRKELSREENPMLTRGLPVEVDGHTLSAWPVRFVTGDHFFALVSAEEMSTITGTDNTNPVILELSIDDYK